MKLGLILSLVGFVLCAADLSFVQVFGPGDGGYPCIRIPSLLTVNDTLLAFAEVAILPESQMCNF
jgi:hypothetical protein